MHVQCCSAYSSNVHASIDVVQAEAYNDDRSGGPHTWTTGHKAHRIRIPNRQSSARRSKPITEFRGRWDGCRPPQAASQCAKVVVR
jgi:hypothetical protein